MDIRFKQVFEELNYGMRFFFNGSEFEQLIIWDDDSIYENKI